MNGKYPQEGRTRSARWAQLSPCRNCWGLLACVANQSHWPLLGLRRGQARRR